MKILLCILIALSMGIGPLKAQHVMISRHATISFFSSAPIEDISAETNKAVSAINTQNGSIYFKVPIRSFQFPKSLMQEHFNTNYLESDKYPFAEFTGNVINYETATLEKDGTYSVIVEGKLTLHGVTKSYREKGILEVGDGKIIATSTFKIRLADHKIEIPTIVFKNIAEVVEVKLHAVYDSGSNATATN